jgi:hypothetical protein
VDNPYEVVDQEALSIPLRQKFSASEDQKATNSAQIAL